MPAAPPIRQSEQPFDLVLFDLDGTLLDPAREIRAAVRRAIAAVVARGVRVGVATGRSPKSAATYFERISATGPLILFNGCMVWDVEQARAVHQANLPREDALRAIEIVSERGVHVNVYVDDEVWIAEKSQTSERSEVKDGLRHTVVGDVVNAIRARDVDIVKLMIIDEQASVMRLAEPLRATMTQPCTLVNSEPEYLEVLAPGVNKGSAIREIEQIYGIPPERVLAFGDRPNDFEMLQAVGMGVAMGNGHADIKRVADVTIGPNDSDAIATFLHEHFAL